MKEFNSLSKELKESFFDTITNTLPHLMENGEDLLFHILVDNIDFQKLIYVTNLNKFLELIEFSNELYDTNKINAILLKENILNMNINKRKFSFFKDVTFLNQINELELLNSVMKLSSITLNNIQELKDIKDLKKVIKLIRQLKQREYLQFELELNKKDKETKVIKKVNYFYLSSGEKTMISYFVNLIAAINEFTNKKNNTFIIFIDEVELHLHPEWQRNFIDYMNMFFTNNRLNIKFQFIIATHSPFILSDLVEEQIVFINQDDKKDSEYNTFGANIYDIFEKGFFLENSIGKCSEKYISELSNTLYLFKSLQYVVDNEDTFLLRNYLNLFYEIDKSSSKSIKEQKRESDKKLIDTIFNELKEQNVSILAQKVSNDSLLKYILVDNDVIRLKERKNIKKSINIIGEPTIKLHLEELYDELEEFEFNANNKV